MSWEEWATTAALLLVPWRLLFARPAIVGAQIERRITAILQGGERSLPDLWKALGSRSYYYRRVLYNMVDDGKVVRETVKARAFVRLPGQQPDPFARLSGPQRLILLTALKDKSANAPLLAKKLGMRPRTVYYHLQMLRDRRLL